MTPASTAIYSPAPPPRLLEKSLAGVRIGVAEAGAEITELAEQLGIPVITSPNGMGCIAGDFQASDLMVYPRTFCCACKTPSSSIPR